MDANTTFPSLAIASILPITYYTDNCQPDQPWD